jgi:protein unc-13 A/B/C
MNKIPSYTNQVNTFSNVSLWFEPFIIDWLNDYDKTSIQYLQNAFQKDKDGNFQIISNEALFSSSVIDIFTQLNQCLNVIQEINTFDNNAAADGNINNIIELTDRYLARFSLSANRIVLRYTYLIRSDFEKYSKDVNK